MILIGKKQFRTSPLSTITITITIITIKNITNTNSIDN